MYDKVKKLALVLLLAAAVGLTACSDTDSESAEADVSESVQTEEYEEVSETISETDAVSDTVTETETVTETAESGYVLDDNFRVSDYMSDFDDAVPSRYTVKQTERTTELNDENTAAYNAALDCYLNSTYYSEAVDEANEYWGYENGEYVAYAEYWAGLLYEFIDESAAPQIAYTAHLTDIVTLSDDEYVFIFDVPLLDRLLAWSGSFDMILPVYVNSDNEAFVLDNAVSQFLHDWYILEYSSGERHMVFNDYPTEGTQSAAIYSFSDKAAKFETSWYSMALATDGSYLLKGVVFENSYLFVWCHEPGRYYGIKGVSPSETIEEIIRGDKNIAEVIPDIDENYDNYEVLVYGGRYIKIGNYCFEYDYEYNEDGEADISDGKKFKETELLIGDPYSAEPGIDHYYDNCLNINLDGDY
jgi:hypothetical protein